MSGSVQQLVGAYLASKGLPMTGENIRRALEMNAANPGIIKGLVNEAPPPPDAQGGAAPTSNQGGSAAQSLAQRMHQAEPQSQSMPTPPIPPQAMAPQPQPQPGSGGGSDVLGGLAKMILGGGAGALGAKFLGGLVGGGGGAMPPVGGEPAPLNIPIPGNDPRVASGGMPTPSPQPQLSAPQLALPPPAQISAPAQIAGPAMPPMPQGAAPASDVASHAPVSIVPRGVGADAADLGGHMDWSKILGEIAQVAGHR